MESVTKSAGDILVVDDSPANLNLLIDLLRGRDFKIRAASSGSSALDSAFRAVPDLVLLDVRMPKMDGYEVCKRLKASPETRHVPVIFISARDEAEVKVKAFQVGGVDYVTKPLQAEEILARIDTHLKNSRLQNEITRQNQSLEEMVAQRTRELLAANQQLALLNHTKNDFLAMISHEVRTPLNGLLGTVDLAFSELEANGIFPESRQMYETSRSRLLSLLDNALLITEIQVKGGLFARNSSSLDDVLLVACDEMQSLVAEADVKIICPTFHLGPVAGDWVFLKKAIVSILETIIKLCRPKSSVEIMGEACPNFVLLRFQGCGATIPDAELAHFFDVFAPRIQGHSGDDFGLAPSVARQIIACLGGWVQIKNLGTQGVEIIAHLPRISNSTHSPEPGFSRRSFE